MAFLAVWFERSLKSEAIDGAFDRRHASRGKLRTGVLWENEKGPGTTFLGLGRPREFRFETYGASRHLPGVMTGLRFLRAAQFVAEQLPTKPTKQTELQKLAPGSTLTSFGNKSSKEMAFPHPKS